jgi:hypothetical protein
VRGLWLGSLSVLVTLAGTRFNGQSNKSPDTTDLVILRIVLVGIDRYRISAHFFLGVQMPKSLRTDRHRALTSVLRATRLERGFTQLALSQKLRHSENYITKIETGERRLDVVEFFEIAQALDVDPVTLFTRIARW